jgi:lysophospholipase L1-like esterase
MSSDTRTAKGPRVIRYLALGDSFTIGTGITADRAFPALLARLWEGEGASVELVNPAVNGYTTDALIATELPLAATLRPTLVTLLVGANDIVRGGDATRYRAQLVRIHAGLRAAGVPADVVVGLPQPDWSLSPAARAYGEAATVRASIEAFNAVMRAECERAGSRYVDLFPLMRRQAAAGMLATDGLHPSAEAHREWADALWEALSIG